MPLEKDMKSEQGECLGSSFNKWVKKKDCIQQ